MPWPITAFALLVLCITAQVKPDLVYGEDSKGPLPQFTIEQHVDRITISHGKLPVATCVFREAQIARPFWTGIHAPGGTPVTRHHPPRPGIDPIDHADMHPGLWLAFGDINGSDFWRNKGRVELLAFVEPPRQTTDGDAQTLTFAVRNRYSLGDKIICEELARHTLRASPRGFLVLLDSQFSSTAPFAFGDQEEMGLGIRLATPLAVKNGSGTIISSEGRKNEKEIWGRQAEWCDYSGIVKVSESATPAGPQSQRVGMLLVPHPGNFNRSWFHARDYGLLVANPFGRKAFTKAEPSRVAVKPGETLRLRFGVWSYAVNPEDRFNPSELAAEYLRLTTP